MEPLPNGHVEIWLICDRCHASVSARGRNQTLARKLLDERAERWRRSTQEKPGDLCGECRANEER